jgi:hypothetical protein
LGNATTNATNATLVSWAVTPCLDLRAHREMLNPPS